MTAYLTLIWHKVKKRPGLTKEKQEEIAASWLRNVGLIRVIGLKIIEDVRVRSRVYGSGVSVELRNLGFIVRSRV